MARKKDTPQKAALREMMGNYMKENNVKVKDGTDVNSIMRDMMSIILEGALDSVSVGRFSPFRVGLKTPISVNLKSPMHHVCY